LGRGFTNCVKGYETMTKAQLTEEGINDSVIHVEFMIGSKDLDIFGITKNGERVQLFKKGNWAF
ncbi:MAG: aminopeptidase, partial [Clostridiales bacterium]|nr:aminopeptidase [Clostridiales bacterium]